MPTPADLDLQDMARNRGFKLVRSRVRTPGRRDYGKYGLERLSDGEKSLGFGKNRLTATAEEVESFLRDQGSAGWTRSLQGAPARKERPEPKAKSEPKPKMREATPAVRKKKAEPAPKPPPPPRPVEIRAAAPGDIAAIRKLLAGIGTPPATLAKQLKTAKANGTIPLVAANESTIAYAAAIALHAPHRQRPIGRLLTLVVDPSRRRTSIGARLLDALEQSLRKAGCGSFEAVAEIDYSGAGAFFRSRGYGRSSYRFDKRS